MFWLICYDIVDDKRRRRIMKTLEGFGRRVQYSVFECELDHGKVMRLSRFSSRIINNDEDNVRFYPMNEADLQKVRMLGNASLERLKGHYII